MGASGAAAVTTAVARGANPPGERDEVVPDAVPVGTEGIADDLGAVAEERGAGFAGEPLVADQDEPEPDGPAAAIEIDDDVVMAGEDGLGTR